MKIRNSKGETFIETLVAILILTVVITGFSNIIASTSKVNAAVKNKRIIIAASSSGKVADDAEMTVTIVEDGEGKKTVAYDVKSYHDPVSGLYYYESDQTKFRSQEETTEIE